jgi:hypothetical protein
VLGVEVNGSGPLLAASAIVGPNPLTRETRKWVYEFFTFVSGVVSAKSLARLFEPGETRLLKIGSTMVAAEFRR